MTDVTCASGVELLMDYLEGVLPPGTARDLEAHVAACERCRAYVESYRQTPRILRDATMAELPAELQQALMAALTAKRHR